MFSRHELKALADRLIDAIDSADDDCELEDSFDLETIEEYEPDSYGGAAHWDIDQRYTIPDAGYPEIRI